MFFTAVDLMKAKKRTLRYEENESRKHPYNLEWGPMHNAVFWFDLRLAPNKGLEFWQTINNAIGRDRVRPRPT